MKKLLAVALAAALIALAAVLLLTDRNDDLPEADPTAPTIAFTERVQWGPLTHMEVDGIACPRDGDWAETIQHSNVVPQCTGFTLPRDMRVEPPSDVSEVTVLRADTEVVLLGRRADDRDSELVLIANVYAASRADCWVPVMTVNGREGVDQWARTLLAMGLAGDEAGPTADADPRPFGYPVVREDVLRSHFSGPCPGTGLSKR